MIRIIKRPSFNFENHNSFNNSAKNKFNIKMYKSYPYIAIGPSGKLRFKSMGLKKVFNANNAFDNFLLCIYLQIVPNQSLSKGEQE